MSRARDDMLLVLCDTQPYVHTVLCYVTCACSHAIMSCAVVHAVCPMFPALGLDEHLTDATLPYEIPSHLSRYWPLYALSTTATCLVTYNIYTHRDELAGWSTQAATSSHAFVDEHVMIPLRNIARHVFHTFYETSTATTATRDPVADALHQYQQSRVNLTDMLLAYGQHHTPAQHTSSLQQRARDGDMSIVMDAYTRQVERPIKSVVFDDLTTGILIQVGGHVAVLAYVVCMSCGCAAYVMCMWCNIDTCVVSLCCACVCCVAVLCMSCVCCA